MQVRGLVGTALMKTVIIIGVIAISAARAFSVGFALVAPLSAAACSGGDTGRGADRASNPSQTCPTTPVDVVVSVDQWGSIVSELGGDCAAVKTVLAASSVDPHDYEPAPADAATFRGAQLVVVNGSHYDQWAAKLAATSAPDAPVISAAEIGYGPGPGDADAVNPHLWYDPAVVTAVADAVTAGLSELAPDAGGYFAARRAAFTESLAPYDTLIGDLRSGAAGKTYAATEDVFEDMAAAVGLRDVTPPGYATAARNDTDPSPADLDAFLKLLQRKGTDVLIFNTQTAGSMPGQLRRAAEEAGVPVVEVTETVAPDAESFEAWQVQQLTALARALGVDS